MPRRREPPEGIAGVSAPETAPGRFEILQAFANTVPVDDRADTLATPAALGRWLSRRGLLPTGVEPSARDLKRFLEIRAALRALLAAKSRGEFDGEAAARLERAAGEARSRTTYDDGGPVAFGPGDATVDGAVGALLAVFALARATPEWPRFRLCARQGCRRAFYDGSRSKTGRWCSSRCGGKVRMAAYRRSRKGR